MISDEEEGCVLKSNPKLSDGSAALMSGVLVSITSLTLQLSDSNV